MERLTYINVAFVVAYEKQIDERWLLRGLKYNMFYAARMWDLEHILKNFCYNLVKAWKLVSFWQQLGYLCLSRMSQGEEGDNFL